MPHRSLTDLLARSPVSQLTLSWRQVPMTSVKPHVNHFGSPPVVLPKLTRGCARFYNSQLGFCKVEYCAPTVALVGSACHPEPAMRARAHCSLPRHDRSNPHFPPEWEVPPPPHYPFAVRGLSSSPASVQVTSYQR